VREVAARRGVRAAKWLGDGVMLVGTEPGPLVATVAELVARFESAGLDTHAGVAGGPVLLFEGDDYIGRPVNLAARLCEAAEANEILAVGVTGVLPSWVTVAGEVTVRVAGVGDVPDVARLGVADEVSTLLRRATPAA
jgi:adenylate cyclase